MPRQGHTGMMMEEPTKIRKRGCSSSSSSSSRIHNYRLNKRAICVGKNRTGLGIGFGRSRSNTPVPTWRTTTPPLRSTIDSPKYSQSGKSTRPVSARKLAATLWEMNEMPSPKISEASFRKQKKNGSKLVSKKEKMQSVWGLNSGSGALPPQLSDPSPSPTTVSVKMDRSGTGGRYGRTSISRRHASADQKVGGVDSLSNASFMEVETGSCQQTSGSVISSVNRLKDVSNALTTTKELLKIINRIWAHADQPSSSLSLVSALHAELERARLNVNQLIQEQRSDKNEINYLMKSFAEEKASWKNKEHRAVGAAVGSIAGELEVERKLRRRLESLNKKLGEELAEMKSSFMEAVKALESEKRAREITEEVCDQLAQSFDEEKADKIRIESVKAHEEVEKEREILELADKVREERARMKLSEAKHRLEGKNSAICKLRKQLEAFRGTKRDKDEERSTYFSNSNIVSHHNEREDNAEVDDVTASKEGSVESDLHSIELNMDDNNNRGYKWDYSSAVGKGLRKLPVTNEIKGRNPTLGLVSRRSTSLQRSVSDVEFHEHEREAPRRSYFDEVERYKSVKVPKDHVLSGSRFMSARGYHSPSQQREQSRPPRDPSGTVEERSSLIQAARSKSRTGDVRVEGHIVRGSKW